MRQEDSKYERRNAAVMGIAREIPGFEKSDESEDLLEIRMTKVLKMCFNINTITGREAAKLLKIVKKWEIKDLPHFIELISLHENQIIQSVGIYPRDHCSLYGDDIDPKFSFSFM